MTVYKPFVLHKEVIYLLNAFSPNMLLDFPTAVVFREISVQTVREYAQLEGLESAVGHPDTAAVFSTVLGIEVPANRITVRLFAGEFAIVGQYVGPRLPEGATELPDNAEIRWLIATVA